MTSQHTPAPSSALPSPPMSPMRLKQKRPDSLYIDSVERTQSSPPCLSTTDNKTVVSRAAIKSQRRQSSIAYFTPSSPSPQSQRSRPQSFCLDASEVISVNGWENASRRSSLILSSRSTSARESVSSLDGLGPRERAPLTLVEKHADLLHFIAQKERKCLELRDQLAAHETELAELKRRWERIVNRGHDPLSSSVSSPGLSGAALDGLKEGVRMITAGFTDLSGVLNDLESGRKVVDTTQTPSTRSPSVHISTRTSSVPSTTDSERRLDTAGSETAATARTVTVATAPSLARAASLNHHQMHKRTSRAFINEPTTPTTNSYAPLPIDPKPAPTQLEQLDVGSSFIFTPSPTLVMPPLSASLIRGKPLPKSPCALMPVAPPQTTWMGTMSKRLRVLPKTTTLAKSQKRASSLLAGVSNTISAALTPGPTATTPAPLPISIATPSMTLKLEVSARHQPPVHAPSHPHPTYTSMTDWLDDEDEHARVGGMEALMPDSKAPTTGGVAATSVSSFDDDWNW